MDEVTIKTEISDVEVKIEPVDEENATENEPEVLESSENEERPEEHVDKPSNTDVVDKVYANGKKNRLPCPKCDRTLKNRANLKQHLRTIHLEHSEDVECAQCCRTFKTKEYLWNHIHAVHRNIAEVACPVCKKVFINKRRLDNHFYYTHKDTTPIPCTKCEKMCNGQRKLKLHMKNVHTFEENIKCPHCNKAFKIEALLKKHVLYSHSKDDIEYKCPCDTVFTSYLRYKKHMTNVHSVHRPRCLLCFKAYKTPQIAKKHLRVCHSLKEKLESYITLKDFPEKPIKVEEPEKITCELCGKIFADKNIFQRHMKTTHPPKEAEKSCDICKKTYKSALHLRIHTTAVHAEEGNLTCEECDRVFSSKKYLLRHKLTHADGLKVQCTMCDKFYKTNAHMRKHLRRVHKNSTGND